MPTTYADDPRTEGQKAMDEFYNGGGYERANPGAFDFFTDMFSTQNAGSGSYDVTDYAYGGSLAAQREAQADLVARGEEGNSVLAEAGNQDYNKLQAGALAQYAAAGEARTSGLNSANVANQYAADTGARANALQTYGDQGSLRNWQSSANALSDYKPTAASQIAGGRLANFSAGSQAGPEQLSSYSELQSYADQGPGPSAAEAQLKSGLDANVANQIALARSGRGSGANAAAMRQAQFQAADLGQRTSADMANLRATEEANWRAQKLQALQGAGSVAANIDQTRLTQSDLNLKAAASGADYANQTEANRLSAAQSAANQYGQQYGAISGNQVATDSSRQNYLNQSLTAQQASANQASAGYDQYLGALNAGVGTQNTAAQNRQNAYQSGLTTQAGYDQAALGVGENEAERRGTLAGAKIGADTQASIANQKADAASDSQNVSTIGTAVGALAAMSDRRGKTSIRRYCALRGE